MFERAKTYSFYLIVGWLLQLLFNWIGSEYLSKFYANNLITIEIALLAINSSTCGLIFSKLKEYNYEKDSFRATIKEIKVSIIEQILIIVLSLVLLVLQEENLLKSIESYRFIAKSILNGFFLYILFILYDVSHSIFLLIEED
ncbi:hypothetical protein [Leptospira interrogans]|uniref:hypothetical protein n=1 Tax=Leptospira interrogans TaxID=173 RepID=UPI0007730610|nr:hypothetical protein [Leptospira interrogans]WOT09331.1 hypothetical protein CFY92_0009370 [Leptospira interrogans]